ncbi:MAG: sugar phosphate isomerase/epimerase [Verrucomicrobiales bacterium]|nr:sugar phosphate isomerase/epimerase [Verrucomicrobiales bacterium]
MTNRRKFLAAASAAAVVPPSLSSAGEFTGIIKKATKLSMVQEPDMSTLEKFTMLKEVGFDGTEVRSSETDKLKEYTAAIEKSGLPVHGVVNSSNPDLKSAIEFSKALGGTSVLYVARYDKKRPLMESWNETKAVVKKGLPHAEKHEVKILVENVWAGFLISALDMERYVDEIDSPWFGAYFDVGNNVRWGIPEHWIQILGKRIGKLDIKEWDAGKHSNEGLRAGFSSELGEGTINWKGVRSALKEIGFKGWATAEVRGGNRERMADIAKRMDKILGLG